MRSGLVWFLSSICLLSGVADEKTGNRRSEQSVALVDQLGGDRDKALEAASLEVLRSLDPQARILSQADAIAWKWAQEAPRKRVYEIVKFEHNSTFVIRKAGTPKERLAGANKKSLIELTREQFELSLPEEKLPSAPPVAFTARIPGTDTRWLVLNGLPQGQEISWKDLGGGEAPGTETANCVILDLRFAGGTNLEAAVQLAAEWHGDRSLALHPATGKKGGILSGRNAEAPRFTQLLVLVSADTRGASELLALLLRQGPKRVRILGVPSSGDFGCRRLFPLGDDQVLLTWPLYSLHLDGKAPRPLALRAPLIPDMITESAGRETTRQERIRPVTPSLGRLLSPTKQEDEAVEEQARWLRHDPVLARAVDLAQALNALSRRASD